MPILDLETTIYPPNLLEDPAAREGERCWWVLYTKSRQEKAVARQLLSWTVPFYLPLVANTHVIRGRAVDSYTPVFNGYVFLFGDPYDRVQSLKTNRISRVLEVVDQVQLTHDLRDIARLIASDAPLTIERQLSAGQRVRIKSGSLTGVEGVVIERRGRNRLLVAVNFLQQGVSMAIDDYQLELLR
jgi:transcriptional antiterminator RfaH